MNHETNVAARSSFCDMILGFVPMLGCLPYSLLYLYNLWGSPHYQFYPILIVCAVLLFLNRTMAISSVGAIHGFFTMALGVALVIAVLGTAFASPWMGYLAFVFSVVAFLLNRRDKETGVCLVGLAVPLLLIWQPPYSISVNGDVAIILLLQKISSVFASRIFDCLGMVHLRAGTILEFPECSYGVSEACSGVQSFFAILSFASLMVAYYRRRLVHTLSLFFSCFGWAVLMNALRIAAIPISKDWVHLDLSKGLPHEFLGFASMLLAMSMLLSTDCLLLLFEEKLIAQNRLSPPLVRLASVKISSGMCVFWVVAFAIVFCLQTSDIIVAWGKQRNLVSFFNKNMILELTDADCPSEVGGWSKISYRRQERQRGADLGTRSDSWMFKTRNGSVVFSVDQVFPGWHELSVCYVNSGLSLKKRYVVNHGDAEWPIVYAEFCNANNEKSILLFSMFDEAGNAVTPPGRWDTASALWHRIKNRLSPAIRGSLFGLAAYQVQLLITEQQSGSIEIGDGYLEEFLKLRDALRASALR